MSTWFNVYKTGTILSITVVWPDGFDNSVCGPWPKKLCTTAIHGLNWKERLFIYCVLYELFNNKIRQIVKHNLQIGKYQHQTSP